MEGFTAACEVGVPGIPTILQMRKLRLRKVEFMWFAQRQKYKVTKQGLESGFV